MRSPTTRAVAVLGAIGLAGAVNFAAAAATPAQTDPSAQAQPAANLAAVPSATARAVGHWLYDLHGNIIGSVRGLADDGRTAVIMLGSYFQPGSHQMTVPIRALSLVDGKVTLQTETAEALSTPTPQGFPHF
jgi:hypothetical protein